MTGHTNTALAYEAFMGRWSNVVVREFLAWLSVPPHGRWLDVGCGTGALASAILQSASPSEVCGIDPSEEYIAYARAMLPQDRCHLLVADAQALPHELSGFDATVSGLALNLVAEPVAAVAEMIRVTRPDGLVARMCGLRRRNAIVAVSLGCGNQVRPISGGVGPRQVLPNLPSRQTKSVVHRSWTQGDTGSALGSSFTILTITRRPC
jgi:ubiquinone/menaquinone biosynthesis C-methylase UbiE